MTYPQRRPKENDVADLTSESERGYIGAMQTIHNGHGLLRRLAERASEFTGVSIAELYSRAQRRRVAWVRFAIMHEAHRRGYAKTRIGIALDRDDTSVGLGIRRVESIASHDPDIRALLAELAVAE